jgi:hypothetical protein
MATPIRIVLVLMTGLPLTGVLVTGQTFAVDCGYTFQ